MNLAETIVRRIDPRRPALITPQGLRRIVLGSDEGQRLAAAAAPQQTHKPLRSAGPFGQRMLVVAHADRGALDEHARQVIAAAAVLAGSGTEVIVAVLGECHDDAAALGIDRLLVAPVPGDGLWRPHAAVVWLDELVSRLAPAQLLLPDRDADADLGRRYAVAAGKSLATGVVELGRDQLRVRAGARLDAVRAPAEVMLLARGVADTRLPFVGLGIAEAAAPLPEFGVNGIEDLGVTTGDAQTLPLEEAEFIIAAGNGVSDLVLFHQLAQALRAATGASRVAVDNGAFARDKQIGATGKTVQARGYLALGISGAVQHLQGIKECRHVIAVNLDAAAPIVRRAELTAVEDCGAFMRALLELVHE